ncbi:hypothetical protein D9M68_65460 [compost metagenome]|jgi:uncharacterized protein DUF3606|uniref:DUF3606 domain-containing protein n=3 Tax=Cupriavidus necator TaxID=106590 RepID=Q0JYJ0_CUPNH|nr:MULTISPECIES: DUF3606 domain-containing protein [Cupriavidus]AEI81300.1 hypothetical protein CNE_2c23530 [Cupriavidus necator N-1]EON20014.1 hypothetical protein C265_09126 [Cupriavidus sp. GA3-3]EYS85183.1 hypothetical protein CF68_12830 [Cupriavidus sp. SK-4]KAI3596085.1 hypothetical protein D8I24_7740 [Cupriavidus necator H850]KUE88433.1 hypothetical protein ASL20_13075 [Cupriavidus necator]
MSDVTNEFRPLDPGRINLMDPLEVQYWCRELGCSTSDLENAVDAAGDHISAVRAQLESNQAGARPG